MFDQQCLSQSIKLPVMFESDAKRRERKRECGFMILWENTKRISWIQQIIHTANESDDELLSYGDLAIPFKEEIHPKPTR